MGSIFRINFYQLVLSDFLIENRNNYNSYGAHLNGENLYSKTIKAPFVLVVGNESQGISDELMQLVDDPIKIPMPANGTINFKVFKSNSFLNLYTAIKSEKIRIGKIIANAWLKGITIVINGTEINDIDPPKPDFAIPYNKIAGTTVDKKIKFISIFQLILIIFLQVD